MKNTYSKLTGFLLLMLVTCFGMTMRAQTTVATTGFLNNNGSNVVTFNFVNNNAFAVIITDVAGITSATGTNTANLYYKPGAIAGPPGAITVGNGWTLGATGTFTSIPNTTTTVDQPCITGASVTIPAGATYGLCFEITNQLRYSTIAPGTYTFSGGGCDIVTGTNIGYGGTTASPINTPRGFLGSLTFIPVAPCVGSPTPGNTTSTANPVCPNANFTLGLQFAQGTGTTYQWQSSPDGIVWTNIVGAINGTYTTNTTTLTYYQCIVTCTNSSLTTTSNPLLVNVAFSAACYCTAIPTQTADEEIYNVTFGSLNNSSTCAQLGTGPSSLAARYADYSSGPGAPAAPIVQAGQSVPFSININTCGVTNFNSGAAIFIDWNQDGDMTDPGEKVWDNGATANITCVPPTTLTGNITVPVTATLGNTVMRVIDAEGFAGTSITPCLAYSYGETEDYLVNIIAASPIDMGATAFTRPLTTGCYDATDSVIVTIMNFGSVPIDFSVNPTTVNASVTGPNAMTFTPVVLNSGILGIGGTMNVTITGTYDMSAAGTYGFSAFTSVGGDGNAANDAVGPVNFVYSAGTAMAGGSGNVCAGSPANVTVSGYMPSTVTIQWQSSPDNVVWTNIVGQTSPTNTEPALDTTFYRAVICGVIMSTVDTVFTISVGPAVATNDTVCGIGTATLTATGSGDLNWFTAQTGGTLVDTGMTINPAVSVTDTFWVENTFVDCGAGGNPIAATCYPTYTSACTSDDFINNFSTTLGSTNISNLNTNCNGAGPSNSTFFPGMAVTVAPGGSFDLAVQSGPSWGQGFRMWIDYNGDGDFGDLGEDVWNSGASSTALYTGTVTVPANTTAGPKRIRLMCRYATVPVTTDHCATTLSFGEVEEYTLNVCTQCGSTRVPSIVTVTPAPPITVASSNNVCGAGTSTLTAASGNGNYGYVWAPGATLNTTIGDTVIASPTQDQYYLATATDPLTGCVDTAGVLVRWGLAPGIDATVSDDTVCANAAVNLDVVSTAMNPAIVGTGTIQNTTTSYPAPYGNYWWGSRHQMLVTAADLTAAGLTAGNITALSFDITNTNASQPLDNFEIKIGNTAITAITAFEVTPMTSVFTSAIYTPTTGINTHTFTTPFFWDGVSNIIVETCHNNGSYVTNCSFNQDVTGYTSTVYYRADAAGVCGNAAVTASIAQRPNMHFWSTQVWDYAWTPIANVNNPAIANPIGYPVTSGNFFVAVTDSVTGCVSTDSVFVFVNPNPAPAFGPDTAICSNATLVLDGTAGPYDYMWQDMTTNQTYTVNSFGNYSVLVTDSITGCIGADTILVGINAAPSFTLGADATVCSGTQVTFSGPAGSYDYNWNTGDSVATIMTGIQGSYELAVTDQANGCTSMDTVMLTVNPVPAVALGADTSVCSASGSIMLSGPAGAYSYQWNTMDTTQSIAVNSTGTYYVVVTDTITSCLSGDTIMVTYNNSPVANLGSDTTFCSANGPLTLAGPFGPYDYMWSDMTTGSTTTAGATGLYYVDVTDTLTGCMTTDSIMVNVPMSPSFTLADTSFCGTQFTINGPVGPYAYSWSNSATTSSITVTGSGTYTLTVTDSTSGCTGMDASTVNINANPTVTASGSDLTPCADDANVILTGSPAGGTFTGTSVTGNQFDPSIGAGSYNLIYNFTDVNGCSGADTFAIAVSACVGIDEQFAFAGMTIYPNPNAGVFTFTAADQACNEMTIEIVTVEGQVIQSNKFSNVQGNFTQEIDMSGFANGVYIMRVTTDGAVYTNRVVKQD